MVPAVTADDPPELATIPAAEVPAPAPCFGSPFGPGLLTYEIVPAWLYSQMVIDKNELREFIPFFGHAIGTTLPVGAGNASALGWANISNTNMYRANQLPPPSYFLVEGIGVVFSPLVEPGLRSVFAERYTAELRVDDKIFFHAPVAMMFDVAERAGEIGPGEEWPEGRGDKVCAARYPVTAYRGCVPLDPPLILEPLRQFGVSLVGRPFRPSGKLSLWVYLKGRHARSTV